MSSVNLFSGESNWLADTFTAIKLSQNQAGLMGMLEATHDGSLNSFFSASKSAANAFGTITQTNTTNRTAFYAQIAAQNLENRQREELAKALEDLQRTQNMVQPTNVLDSYIYFEDGSSLDTENNILTMSDGKKIDTITGVEVIDPSTIIDMGNGSYLNTKTNVLTLADGTKIDTVTGLKLSDLED